MDSILAYRDDPDQRPSMEGVEALGKRPRHNASLRRVRQSQTRVESVTLHQGGHEKAPHRIEPAAHN